MTALRTFPLRTAPRPGESLDSWLEAAAVRLRVTMAELYEAMGFASPHSELWRHIVLRPTDTELAAISATTGLTARAGAGDDAEPIRRYRRRNRQRYGAIRTDYAVGSCSRISILPALPASHRWCVETAMAADLDFRVSGALLSAGRLLPRLRWGATLPLPHRCRTSASRAV